MVGEAIYGCGGCGTEFPAALLSCPSCHRLVHVERLQALSRSAREHAAAGRTAQELSSWREALALLPPRSHQYAEVRRKVDALAAAAPAAGGSASSGGLGRLAALGALGLLLWKFKWVLGFVLTKAKFLLGGLTKMSTFLSMGLAMGVYWSLWGWKFAAGFVLSIYVHEMGHVMALRRLGIAASAPMFVPGLGAFVRMKQYPASVGEDAEVGLEGPLWGMGAALACLAVGQLTDSMYWAALARTGAWLNLFNLFPVWQLDGGRGFRALTRKQRALAAGAIGLAWLLSGEGLLLLLLLGALYRCFAAPFAEQEDRGAFVKYVVLVGVLSWLTTMAPVSQLPAR